MQVLLFYPDGKRSSSAEGHIDAAGQMLPAPAAGGGMGGQHHAGGGGAAAGDMAGDIRDAHGAMGGGAPAAGGGGGAQQQLAARQPAPRRDTTVGRRTCTCFIPVPSFQLNPLSNFQLIILLNAMQNEYAALFVALIGEGPNPQVLIRSFVYIEVS